MSKKADMASLPADQPPELAPRSRLVADGLPLPPALRAWFAGRGWELRGHQAALLQKAAERRSCLLIAPTGSGKTLAGFLPSLVDLSRREGNSGSLHTLYISPLKALAADIERNLLVPVQELSLPVRIETRTGDTSICAQGAPAHATARDPAHDPRAGGPPAGPSRFRASAGVAANRHRR